MTHTSAHVSDGDPKLKRIRGIPRAIPLALLPPLVNYFPVVVAFAVFSVMVYWFGEFLTGAPKGAIVFSGRGSLAIFWGIWICVACAHMERWQAWCKRVGELSREEI